MTAYCKCDLHVAVMLTIMTVMCCVVFVTVRSSVASPATEPDSVWCEASWICILYILISSSSRHSWQVSSVVYLCFRVYICTIWLSVGTSRCMGQRSSLATFRSRLVIWGTEMLCIASINVPV